MQMLNQETLKDEEMGKSDVSWLSWRRNTLGAKLHRLHCSSKI